MEQADEASPFEMEQPGLCGSVHQPVTISKTNRGACPQNGPILETFLINRPGDFGISLMR